MAETKSNEDQLPTQAAGTLANDIDPTLSTVGKPVDGGCVYFNFNPDGATLPTDATTKISTLSGFESVGEASEDGVTFTKSVTTDKKKGWHNETVISAISDEERTLKLTLIEPGRPAAAKAYYGAAGVETDTDGSVSKISDIAGTQTSVAAIIDMLESNGKLRRVVVPKMTIDSFDDVSAKAGDLVSYGITATLLKKAGEKALKYVYRAKPAE